MKIHLKEIGRARQAAKYLKQNLDLWRLQRPLTWHQDTIAFMLGHADWKALLQAVERGVPSSPPDKECTAEEAARRHEYQTDRLIACVGAEKVDMACGRETFAAIARRVAPSGRPIAGTAHRTVEAVMTGEGIAIPITLEHWSEDALFSWHDVNSSEEFDHVAEVYDPIGEALYDRLVKCGDRRNVEDCVAYVEGKPGDFLDGLTILSHLYLLQGDPGEAAQLIFEAFDIASHAWAQIARERRLRHDPVRWWDEETTRPFMRVLHQMALWHLFRRTDEGKEEAMRIFGSLLALNPADPFGVRQIANTEFVFYDDKIVGDFLSENG